MLFVVGGSFLQHPGGEQNRTQVVQLDTLWEAETLPRITFFFHLLMLVDPDLNLSKNRILLGILEIYNP